MKKEVTSDSKAEIVAFQQEVKCLEGTITDDLAKLSSIDYDRQRASIAKELGVRVSTLDREVERAREKLTQQSSRNPPTDLVETLIPWDEPVDGAALLNEIKNCVHRFVILPDSAADAAALWIVFTYFHQSSRISPILGITAPDKRCGKTNLLTVVGRLSFRSISTSNITPAALFRLVEKHAPTLCIDEADTFLKMNPELRGILNSGHTRDTAYVIRTVGEDFEPQKFTTWAAKAIALIGQLPPTLADRSIPIRMQRKLPMETVARLGIDQDSEFHILRGKCARFAKDALAAYSSLQPFVPAELNDRAQDNWRPLLAISELVGGDWRDRGIGSALALSGIGEVEDSASTLLLQDIRTILQNVGTEGRIFSEVLVESLLKMEERPWAEWRHGKPMTKTSLAKHLKPFGIRPTTIRIGAQTARGYDVEQFGDVFSRYLPHQTATLQQFNAIKDFRRNSTATQARSVALLSGSNCLENQNCCGVTDDTTEIDEERAAIYEFEAGMTRCEAEQRAANETRPQR